MVDLSDPYKNFLEVVDASPIVPVITIETLVPVKEIGAKLKALGYQSLEITLRTPVALEAIRILKATYPDLLIGAGTIVQPEQVEATLDAGCDFLVTPATPLSLAQQLISCPVPVLPGCSTATEAQTLYTLGFKIMKLFPAEASGGVKLLKSLSKPLPHLQFMPTGGITRESAQDYLDLPNVVAIGGSWMMKPL